MILARYEAIKAVKAQLRASGVKLAYIEQREIVRASYAYLEQHPELIEQAAETVRKVPQLRTLAEREGRRRKRKRA